MRAPSTPRLAGIIPDLALALVALIWGSTFIMVKQALEGTSPLLFLALRFTLASFALAAVFRLRPVDLASRPREFRGGILTGLFLFAGFAFQTFGLRLTTPSKSAFVTGLYIVLVPLLGSLVYKKAPHPSEGLGVALATAGMGLMTIDPETFRIGTGDWLTLVCAFAFAAHILLVGHYTRLGGVEMLSLSQIAAAAVLAGATFWWVETPRVRWDLQLGLALVVTALLATALAFAVQVWAQRRVPPTRAALIFSLEPVFAWLTSLVVAGEILSLRASAGAALILGGIVLVELKPVGRRPHPSKQAGLPDPV